MEFEAEPSMITRNLRSAKEQAGIEIDYDAILAWQYGTAISVMGTPLCDSEIKKLEVMLHPFLDAPYYKRLGEMSDERKKFIEEGKGLEWDTMYQAHILSALTDLMKRRGLLPMGMV